MKLIPLTQGQFAKVDDADYDELSKHKWCAHWHHRRSLFYAVRSSRTPNGKIRTIMMHRQVLGLIDRKTHGDHKNHNTLDNQRENIRAVTNSQNHMNRNAVMFSFLDARVGRGNGNSIMAPDYLMKKFRISRGVGRTVSMGWVKTYTSKRTVEQRVDSAFGRGK